MRNINRVTSKTPFVIARPTARRAWRSPSSIFYQEIATAASRPRNDGSVFCESLNSTARDSSCLPAGMALTLRMTAVSDEDSK